ncbi:MAG TPA: C-type lectin domain-containing protein [Polyangiaceae bacterium]
MACASIAAAAACLPDLALFQPDGGDAAVAGPSCGDGIVELDSGEQCDPDAGVIGCTASCTIDCDGGVVDDASGHCYFWVPNVDSTLFASNQCSAAGGHIVSFVDPTEMLFVLNQTKSLPSAAPGASWLSLLQLVTSNDAGATVYSSGLAATPGWAYTCPGCYAAVEAGAQDIQRPTSGNPQPCVDWRKSGGPWVQTACSLGFDDAGDLNKSSALCEREPPGSFATPCASSDAGDICAEIPRTFGKKRYVLGPPRAFDVARAECTARGGVLAHFQSSAEREQAVLAVSPFLVTSDFWIGLAFDDDAGAWRWDDGAAAPPQFPTPWADLEPSVNAGAASIHLDVGAFDTALAHAQFDTMQTFQYLCQLAD